MRCRATPVAYTHLFSAETPEGRNFWFGIREHAMAAICNGIAYDLSLIHI